MSSFGTPKEKATEMQPFSFSVVCGWKKADIHVRVANARSPVRFTTL